MQWAGLAYLAIFFGFFAVVASPLALWMFRYDVRPGTQRAFDSSSFLAYSEVEQQSIPDSTIAMPIATDSAADSVPFTRTTLFVFEVRLVDFDAQLCLLRIPLRCRYVACRSPTLLL
jgi:hypothetical protein